MQELCGYDRARYYFEHEMLSNWFYKGGAGKELIRELQKDGDFYLWNTMVHWCKEAGEEMRDTKGQYKVSVCKRTKDYSMIRIDMPNPPKELLCFHVYLVFSDDCQYRRYFTVEKGESSEVRFLCSREPDGGHSNFGQCSSDMDEIERRIGEIFTNQKQRFFRKSRKLWWSVPMAVFIGVGVVLNERRKKRRERDEGI